MPLPSVAKCQSCGQKVALAAADGTLHPHFPKQRVHMSERPKVELCVGKAQAPAWVPRLVPQEPTDVSS